MTSQRTELPAGALTLAGVLTLVVVVTGIVLTTPSADAPRDETPLAPPLISNTPSPDRGSDREATASLAGSANPPAPHTGMA